MIVPRRIALLVLAAVAALATSASAKRSAQSDAKQWMQRIDKMDAQLVEETRAAIRNPALRGSDVVAATDTYQPAMMFVWSENGCPGDAYTASYLSTVCAVRDEGVSTRYNCVISTPPCVHTPRLWKLTSGRMLDSECSRLFCFWA